MDWAFESSIVLRRRAWQVVCAATRNGLRWPGVQDYGHRTTGRTTFDGISTSGLPVGTALHAIVFDNQVFGAALPADVRTRVIALAGLAEARLLGVDLITCSEGDWWFTAASVLPDLRIGGEGLLDALTPALGGPAT